MSCMCGHKYCGAGLGALGAVGLPAQSRVLYSAETEAGMFSIDDVITTFKNYLRQRGLQVEDVTYSGVGISSSLAYRYRIFAQVVTPIDRAKIDDLTYDMTQDLLRASGYPVTSESISVTIWGQKDEYGNTIYTQHPGDPTPPGQKKSIWQEIAEMFDIEIDEAKLIGVGAAALFAILLVRR